MSSDMANEVAGPSSSPRAETGDREAFTRFLLITLFSLMVLRLVFMDWLPLTDTTEARYAEIARKMLETGNWITPQFDYDVPFWGKPPLHTWLAAGGMAAFGVGAFAARFPILLVSLGVLWILLVFARASTSRITALLAITICATSFLFFGAAAFVMTDMAMVLGTTLSMAAFFLAVQKRSDAGLWGHLFFAGLALGLLAKGPTAVVLTVLPCGLWLVVRRRLSDLSCLPWVSGTALMLLTAGPWYVAAEIATPGFLRYFLIGEHIERFLIPGWQGDLYGSGHREPKGMIWLFAFGVLLPWTPLTFALLFLRRWKRTDADLMSYLAFWTLSPMLLFTPAANILPAYVLPAIPAFALLTALLIEAHPTSPHWPRKAAVLCCAVALCFFATVVFASRFAPATLGLRSMETMVAQATGHGVDIQVSTYPWRSYSAEFYSAGRAKAVTEAQVLQGLAHNETRDAVILSNHLANDAERLLGPAFSLQLTDHRSHLFVERAR